MVRFFAASVVALSLMATSAVAQDDSATLLRHFKTLCADGEGSGPRALQMARAADWAPIPPSVFAGEDSPFDDVTVLMNAEEGDVVSLLVVGTMTQEFEGTPLSMKVCATMGGDFGSNQLLKPYLGPTVRQWLGFEPHPDMGGEMVGYAFTRDGEAMTRVRGTDAALMQAMLNGRLHMVMLNAEDASDGITMLMYMRPNI